MGGQCVARSTLRRGPPASPPQSSGAGADCCRPVVAGRGKDASAVAWGRPLMVCSPAFRA
ncbi:hypothetical protein [Azospirillum largimobile]